MGFCHKEMTGRIMNICQCGEFLLHFLVAMTQFPIAFSPKFEFDWPTVEMNGFQATSEFS